VVFFFLDVFVFFFAVCVWSVPDIGKFARAIDDFPFPSFFLTFASHVGAFPAARAALGLLARRGSRPVFVCSVSSIHIASKSRAVSALRRPPCLSLCCCGREL